MNPLAAYPVDGADGAARRPYLPLRIDIHAEKQTGNFALDTFHFLKAHPAHL
jgi:hypothetical protein